MQHYRTQSWIEILTFYSDLGNAHHWPFQPLLDLVQFITTSPYAQGLFPVTSQDLRRIGHYPNFLAGDGEFTIQFLPNQNRFVFTDQSHPTHQPPWSHHYEAEDVQQALEHFLVKKVRWLRNSKAASGNT